jgi:hypothetical protein
LDVSDTGRVGTIKEIEVRTTGKHL